MRGRSFVVGAAVAIASLASSCGAGGSRSATAEITVLAASSLRAAFDEMGVAFAAENDAYTVRFSYAGSTELASQIEQGAPADVFAAADIASVERVGADLVGPPAVFATNQMTIIVEPGNPLAISGLADLAADDVTVVLCATEVPCGTYAAAVLASAGVEVVPASLEQKVAGVVSKVQLGEADAGIVYVTDARAAGATVGSVSIPDDLNLVAEYPIVTIAASANGAGAQAFIDFVLSPAGQAILASHGFGSV